jgi:hypothetical protein
MTTIVSELIGIARRVGRWVINRLIKRGAMRLGAYMIERAEGVFTERLKRAKTARRKRWLRGRIRRWQKAGAWLMAWAADVARCVANEADYLLAKAKRLPIRAKCETLRGAA